jgi:hypothetical protein
MSSKQADIKKINKKIKEQKTLLTGTISMSLVNFTLMDYKFNLIKEQAVFSNWDIFIPLASGSCTITLVIISLIYLNKLEKFNDLSANLSDDDKEMISSLVKYFINKETVKKLHKNNSNIGKKKIYTKC